MCSVFIDNFLLNNCHCLERLKLWQSRNTQREKKILLKAQWREKSLSLFLTNARLICINISCHQMPFTVCSISGQTKGHLLHKTLSNFSSPTLTSLYLLDSCSFGVPVTFLELLVLYFMQNIDSLLISHMHVSYIHF